VKDVEYVVSAYGRESDFSDANQAAGRALDLALLTGKDVHFDVLVYSEAGARAYGGDDAVERYLEDPDASVFERIVVKAESLGSIP